GGFRSPWESLADVLQERAALRAQGFSQGGDGSGVHYGPFPFPWSSPGAAAGPPLLCSLGGAPLPLPLLNPPLPLPLPPPPMPPLPPSLPPPLNFAKPACICWSKGPVAAAAFAD